MTTNLLEFTSFVISGFRKNRQTYVVYADLSKAFDSVNHPILVRKLDLLGFLGDLLSWILSYLNYSKVFFIPNPSYIRCTISLNEVTGTYVRR